MTLLERFDRFGITATFKAGVKVEEIRRAIAIAQAVDEAIDNPQPNPGMDLLRICNRAEELLRGEP